MSLIYSSATDVNDPRYATSQKPDVDVIETNMQDCDGNKYRASITVTFTKSLGVTKIREWYVTFHNNRPPFDSQEEEFQAKETMTEYFGETEFD